MSLNDLQLPHATLSALYANSLVIPDGEMIESSATGNAEILKEVPAKEESFKFLGSNQKNVLVVVDYDEAVFLPDAALGFLTNLLTACKRSLADVAIINIHQNKTGVYKETVAYFKSKVVLLFGVEPAGFGLPVNFPVYQVQSVANCTFLYSPALELQQNDPLLKSKLWVSLRTIFGI